MEIHRKHTMLMLRSDTNACPYIRLPLIRMRDFSEMQEHKIIRASNLERLPCACTYYYHWNATRRTSIPVCWLNCGKHSQPRSDKPFLLIINRMRTNIDILCNEIQHSNLQMWSKCRKALSDTEITDV